MLPEPMTYELTFHAPHGQLLLKEWVQRPNHAQAVAYAAERVQHPAPWEGVRVCQAGVLVAAFSRFEDFAAAA